MTSSTSTSVNLGKGKYIGFSLKKIKNENLTANNCFWLI